MKEIDLNYICKSIGDLSGVPIRVLQNGEPVFFHASVTLPTDPASLYLEELSDIREHIGYLITKDFYNYGVVSCENIMIILGPTRQIAAADTELRELAFLLGVSKEERDVFLSGMKSIVRMPLESILQILCTLNYVLNDEKLELRDVQIRESEQLRLKAKAEQARVQEVYSDSPLSAEPTRNTLDLENSLMSMIAHGDTAALREWLSSAPAVRGGTIASEQLRQRKNMFVVTATLASRAAIRGGLDAEDALSLSDRFIQNCELLSSPDSITNLQYHMILEFTERVERLRKGGTPSPLVLSVSRYIQRHMSESISASDVAAELHLNRSYLTRRIRAETGDTLTDFILKEKTEEAKRLLRYTNKTATAIGIYLGFSSLGHFSRVFKRYAGVTPHEYREKHEKA